MLASQLLRILETIPTDMKCETRACDSAAQAMIMKENQNATHFDSENLGSDARPSPLEAKGTEEFWKPKFDDDQIRTEDFEAEEFENGTFCRLDSLEDDIDSESTDTNVKDEESDCRSPYVAALDLFEGDKNSYTDKNVVEYEMPELIVCYKEINYHVVKDICVDEGMPANRKVLLGDVDEEALVSNELEPAPLDCTELPSDERSLCKAGASATSASSFVDNTLPIQEFGTRSFLRSFLNTLDGEEGEVQELRDQFPGELVSEGAAAATNEDVQKSILNYNSEVETRSITFNFNSLQSIKEQSLDSREMIDQNEEAVVSFRRFDRGEGSFSADSFVTHLGPIPFSGSLSLCSDGSATSGRSFAFPELQTEWNSSPVRMTAADRRRFRRHKGWRSGLLCCRF